jgi:protein-S-isoprenylcysteine O-methyltransferase Ste14
MPADQLVALRGIQVAWVIWVAVWVVMSRGVKATVRRESRLSRLGHMAPLAVAAVLLCVTIPETRWLGGAVAARGAWMAPAGLVLTVAGIGFCLWARFVLAGNWSGTVTVKQDHELVVSGPYRVVRHPIYTGLLLAMIGTGLAIDRWRAVLAVLLVAFAFVRKIRTEEGFMTETFGLRYEAYARMTAALVPGVW